MAVRSGFLLRLRPADRALLDRLANTVEVDRATLLRWSLHYYALHGPWTTNPGDRDTVVGEGAHTMLFGTKKES